MFFRTRTPGLAARRTDNTVQNENRQRRAQNVNALTRLMASVPLPHLDEIGYDYSKNAVGLGRGYTWGSYVEGID